MGHSYRDVIYNPIIVTGHVPYLYIHHHSFASLIETDLQPRRRPSLAGGSAPLPRFLQWTIKMWCDFGATT